MALEFYPSRSVGRSGRLVMLVTIMFALVLTACGAQQQSTAPTEEPPSSESSAPAPSATEGAPSVDTSNLVVAVSDLGDENWHPLSSPGNAEIVDYAVHDHLIRQDGQGLAESYELSDDGTTWTFVLREGIQFHGGFGELTAEDVKFSWEQFIHPDQLKNSAVSYRQAIDDDIDNFEIVGPYEFELHTTRPLLFLPAALSNAQPSSLTIQSKAYWDEDPEVAAAHPIGTGPWEFVSHTPGIEVQLSAVADHWRQTPAFENVTLQIIADEAAQLAQVRSGDVDLAPLHPSLIGEAEAAELEIRTIPETALQQIILGGQYAFDPERNDAEAPWIQADNPEQGRAIREALSLAIDREAIVDVILGGNAQISYSTNGLFPSMTDAHDPDWELPAYDPERASELLAEGGYPDGFDIKQWIVSDDSPASGEIGEAVAGYWEAIGVRVERVPTEFATTIRPAGREKGLRPNGNHGFAYVFTVSYREEIAQLLQTNSIQESNSLTTYHPAFDEGYAAMSVEPDKRERDLIAREMYETLRADLPVIPLFAIDTIYASGPKVGDWQPTLGFDKPSNLESIVPPQ